MQGIRKCAHRPNRAQLLHTIHRTYTRSRDKLKFIKQILDERHEYGTINETLEVVKVIDKGPIMDIHESSIYIYKHNKMGKHFNEQHNITSNVLFDLLLKQNIRTWIGRIGATTTYKTVTICTLALLTR
jgi:hypothetical protein